MIQDDIEKLKQFGNEIKDIQKHTQSNTQSSQGNSSQLHLKDRVYCFILKIVSHLKFCCKPFKKIKNRLFSKIGIVTFIQKVFNSHYTRVYLRKPSPKYFTRLIETKKQIGDTTIIVRKRMHVKQSSQHDENLFDTTVEPSLYYFHQRLMNYQMMLQNHRNHESLFDIPNGLQKQKQSFKDRILLFFLRL